MKDEQQELNLRSIKRPKFRSKSLVFSAEELNIRSIKAIYLEGESEEVSPWVGNSEYISTGGIL